MGRRTLPEHLIKNGDAKRHVAVTEFANNVLGDFEWLAGNTPTGLATLLLDRNAQRHETDVEEIVVTDSAAAPAKASKQEEDLSNMEFVLETVLGNKAASSVWGEAMKSFSKNSKELPRPPTRKLMNDT
jgi:hypothetical protein